MTTRPRSPLLLLLAALSDATAFLPAPPLAPRATAAAPSAALGRRCPRPLSVVGENSDYSTDESDYAAEAEVVADDAPVRGGADLADVPPVEEIPVPNSRNNVGNRFLAVVFDRELSTKYDDEHDSGYGDVAWDRHYDRVSLTEDHVMWARKQNLYNETFNTESMADVLWSRQL